MAGWTTMKNQQMPNSKGFDETHDLVMGVMLSQKPGNDLIQNCDLPPPMKVFSGTDNKTVIGPMKAKKASGLTVKDEDTDDGDGKMGILKALRLSQTRAREAEAKCTAIAKERDTLAVAFMEDSMQVFAYRQLLRLLEFQVSQLQQQRQEDKQVCCDGGKGLTAEADDGSGSDSITWFMAVAFCFGIAGFGFAVGCKYLYF